MGDHKTSMCGLTSSIWLLGLMEPVSSAADLDGTFIVPDVTALA